MPGTPLYILYGTGMTIGTLLGAWFLNSVFERNWEAIALILLAMLIVILVQRMIMGAIPTDSVPPEEPDQENKIDELPGIAPRYGWMALPPGIAFVVVLIALIA